MKVKITLEKEERLEAFHIWKRLKNLEPKN